MCKWIWENKDWLFSGCGLFAIMWLINYIRKRISKNHEPQQLSTETPKQTLDAVYPNVSAKETERPSRPKSHALIREIQDIANAIESSPPSREKDVCADFAGTYIRALGDYSSFYKGDGEMVCIGMRVAGATRFYVYFDIQINDYPEFKTIQKSTPLYIEGRIQRIDYSCNIYVDEVEIRFPPVASI